MNAEKVRPLIVREFTEGCQDILQRPQSCAAVSASFAGGLGHPLRPLFYTHKSLKLCASALKKNTSES